MPKRTRFRDDTAATYWPGAAPDRQPRRLAPKFPTAARARRRSDRVMKRRTFITLLGGVAARGARAAKAADDRVSRLDCALDGEPAGRRAFGKASRARLDRGPNRRNRASLGGKPHGAIRGDCD